MNIGLFVVGDEILSGKRQDRHLPKVISLLSERGMSLDWAEFIADDRDAIAAAVRRRRDALVLSCGGIGATPDDCTRQGAAQGFDLPLERHPEAQALIVAEYGERAFPNRVLMADFPRGARLIPNPVNRVAGFSVGHHHFVPGFPDMAWPMLSWVLDQHYRHLHSAEPPVEYRLRALGHSAESDLLALMEEVLRRFPGIKLSSLPFRGDAQQPRHIEFGIKGPRQRSAEAFLWFREQLISQYAAAIEDLSKPDAS
jgi:molybdopterin-biosynthesis enzyme MoeA-like protein